jgi:hypothetical protein
MMKNLAGLTATLLFLGGCSSNATQPEKQPETLSQSELETMLLQRATVTEVFHLRSECVALGRKIEEDMQKHPEQFLVTDTETNYSVSANRCYVLVVASSMPTVSRPADNTGRTVFSNGAVESRVLYDGQTGETLALAQKFTDSRPSRGYIGHILDGSFKEADYSKASDYINRLMDDGEPKQ